MADSIDDVVERVKKESDVFSKARLVGHLLKDKKVKVADLSKKLGINSSYVCHLNRLNRLPDIIIDAYYSKLLTVSHLFLLSRVKDFEKVVAIYEAILAQGLTIQATENMVREYLYGVKPKGNYLKETEREKLSKALTAKYPGLDVKIVQTRVYGKIAFTIKGSLDLTSRLIKDISSKLSD